MASEEEELKRIVAEMNGATDAMTNGIAEAMMPMMGAGQLLSDEAKAWDGYVGDVVRVLRDAAGNPLPSDIVQRAAAHADAVLAERRKRFNENAIKERLRGMMPSGQGLCNAPLIVDGKETGFRCWRNANHDGSTHY